jgi:hypothetical protein
MQPLRQSRPLWRRVPWWAVTITVAVLVSAALPAFPIRDAVTLKPIDQVSFVLSTNYLLIAPVSNLLDTLTLLSVPQHIAVVVTLIVFYAAARARRARLGFSWARESIAAGTGLAVLVLVYAAAAILPRPMAAIAVSDAYSADVLVADFHSHTKYSHDGRPGFGPEANRAWHRGGGFDVAYITDHRTFQGAEEGIVSNPPQAGEGTMILQGLEAGSHGAHVIVLGAGRVFRGLTDSGLVDIDDRALQLASLVVGREPVLIFTFPGAIRDLRQATGPGTPGIRAIEMVDGSPRGLTQIRRERDAIKDIADSIDLVPVAGSDNHGWGYAVPAWTLLAVRGWRGMGTDSLASAIERTLRVDGFGGAHVIERRIAHTESGTLHLVLTVPLVLARMFTMLSDNERVMWLIWVWAVVIARLAWRRRRLEKPGAHA